MLGSAHPAPDQHYRQMVKAQKVLDAMPEGLKRDILRFQAGRGD
jgi:hypothetical protein